MPTGSATTPTRAALTNAAQPMEAKTVILQALNRWMHYPGNPNGLERVFYTADSFQGTEPMWDRTPLIFTESGEHPDLHSLEADFEGELARTQGRVVGTINNTQVVTGPGQPRATCSVAFTDPAVAALYEKGELGLSTGLFAHVNTATMETTGKVVPNHVLAFRTTKTNQPRDGGAMFLNNLKTEAADMTDKIDGIMAEFSNKLKAALGLQGKEGDPTVNDDPTKDLQVKLTAANNTIQTKENELTAKTDEIAALKEQLTNTKKELDEFRQAKADEAWEALKNTQIPPGLVKKEEDEKALRELYNSNKDAFYQKLLGAKGKAPATGGTEGAEFMNNQTDAELEKLNSEWEQLTGAN